MQYKFRDIARKDIQKVICGEFSEPVTVSGSEINVVIERLNELGDDGSVIYASAVIHAKTSDIESILPDFNKNRNFKISFTTLNGEVYISTSCVFSAISGYVVFNCIRDIMKRP